MKYLCRDCGTFYHIDNIYDETGKVLTFCPNCGKETLEVDYDFDIT